MSSVNNFQFANGEKVQDSLAPVAPPLIHQFFIKLNGIESSIKVPETATFGYLLTELGKIIKPESSSQEVAFVFQGKTITLSNADNYTQMVVRRFGSIFNFNLKFTYLPVLLV